MILCFIGFGSVRLLDYRVGVMFGVMRSGLRERINWVVNLVFIEVWSKYFMFVGVLCVIKVVLVVMIVVCYWYFGELCFL